MIKRTRYKWYVGRSLLYYEQGKHFLVRQQADKALHHLELAIQLSEHEPDNCPDVGFCTMY